MRLFHRAGLTLFEVAISMLLLAISMLVVLAAIPVGVRMQEQARQQVLASTLALNLVESFNSLPNADSNIHVQATNPWEVPLGNRISDHDLETRLLGMNTGGLLPMPLVIARRLESDNDEIQQILADGGTLYYPSPRPPTFGRAEDATVGPPNEMQRLVVGFAGYAQQNSIGHFPWRPWPIRMASIAPPFGQQDTNTSRQLLWESTDADLARVMKTTFLTTAPPGPIIPYLEFHHPYHSFIPGNFNAGVAVTDPGYLGEAGYEWYSKIDSYNGYDLPNRERAWRYLALAVWYARTTGLDPAWIGGARATVAMTDSLLDQPRRAVAARVLAHAGMCLTRHHTKAQLDAGVIIPGYAFQSPPGGALPIAGLTTTLSGIVAWFENAKDLAMAIQVNRPYDWGMPRPLDRTLMIDVPLLQWDLYEKLPSGIVAGSTEPASQWRVLSPQPVVNASSTNWVVPASVFTDAAGVTARYNLTARFDASERCRQIVVWSVDWQSYADFESAPSAPQDAARYPLDPYTNSGQNSTFVGRMLWDPTGEGSWNSFRNPEKSLCFVEAPVSVDPGATSAQRNASTGKPLIAGRDNQYTPLTDLPDRNRSDVYLGLFGADRNGNGSYDRGKRPTSLRMKAVVVGRFNVYDPRLPTRMR